MAARRGAYLRHADVRAVAQEQGSNTEVSPRRLPRVSRRSLRRGGLGPPGIAAATCRPAPNDLRPLHGDPDTYRYIPESIRRYPGARGLAGLMSDAGFVDARHHDLLGGLMAICTATRPA